MLFFVDNIFRFTQAGADAGAARVVLPSAVGYQRHCRRHRHAARRRPTSSITSVQAIYVPADDLTDPGAGHLVRPPRRDDRAQPHHLELGIYPAVDPLELDLARATSPHHRRELRHRPRRPGDAAEVLQVAAGHHRDPPSTSWKKWARSAAPARSSASCRSRSTSPKCSPAFRASSSIKNAGHLAQGRERRVRPPFRKPPLHGRQSAMFLLLHALAGTVLLVANFRSFPLWLVMGSGVPNFQPAGSLRLAE